MKLIKKVIDKIGEVHDFLQEVYEEAYEIKPAKTKEPLEKQFAKQVEKIKEENKREAIEAISTIAAVRFFKDTGFFMPKEEAEKFAERFFERTLEQGKLDELYKPKEI